MVTKESIYRGTTKNIIVTVCDRKKQTDDNMQGTFRSRDVVEQGEAEGVETHLKHVHSFSLLY